MALYQMSQQEQLLQLQNCLLTLPVSPTPPRGPHILPYVESVFRHYHPLYVPVRKQEPLPLGSRLTVATTSTSLSFSSHSVPEPIRNRSTVTIQEIQDEKAEESSKFSPSVVPEQPSPVLTNVEPRIKDPVQEEGNQKTTDLESKTNLVLESKCENSKMEGSQPRLSGWVSHRNLDSGFRLDNLQFQNSRALDSSQSYPRTQYPASASSHRSSKPPSSSTAHALIRTATPIPSARPMPQNFVNRMLASLRMRRVPSCSIRAGSERMNLRLVHPNFMAPAVRIRTVVPVCSTTQTNANFQPTRRNISK